jgi:hypothetical protein
VFKFSRFALDLIISFDVAVPFEE